MADEESDNASFTPGKLQDLKKMFEEKNAQSSDSSATKALAGRGRPVLPATPPKPIPGANCAHPKPAPRQLSPAKRGMTTSEVFAESSNSVPEGEEPPLNYGTVPRPRRRTTSRGQDWSSTLERKPAAQKKPSPTVSRRIAMFSEDKGGDEDDSSVVERRVLSPRVKSGNTKRLSDPCTDMDGLFGRTNSAERRKTMDNFSFPDTASKPGEVKVQNQIRKFQEKPSLPKKPVIVSAAHPHSGNTQQSVAKVEQSENNYEVPWDLKPGKNVERLKALSGDQQSPQKGKSPAQDTPTATAKDKGAGRSTLPRPKSQASRPISRPTEQPPPPPSKPPRTFVHTEYLEGKGQGHSPDNQNTKMKPPSERDAKLSVSIPEGSSVDEHGVTLSGGGKPSHPSSAQESRETKGIREKPPTRPPPPRPRPISEASTLNRRKVASPRQAKDVNSAEACEGPVVISAKTGRPISRQVSMSNPHRKPNDRLPEKPEGEGSLQRFPLRKSFSSECLYKGSVSSLSDMGSTEEPAQGSMMQSYHPGDYGGEPIYEVLIDTEGYAVPNQFIRCLPNNDQMAKGGQVSPNRTGFLKRLLAPSSSSAGTPPSIPTTTPVKDQDVEKVSAKKMNLVKQKINQAYEALQVVFRGPSVSEEGEQDNPTTEEPESTDSDSIVDVKEIKRRVTYCSTVRLRTLQSVKKAREFMDRIYPQLFEYALIVGLSAKTDDPGYEPVILHKFPQNVESNVSVPKFCFPDAEEFRPGSVTSTSESYSFVLTHMDGHRMYGYCRRIQPRDSSLPEVICIISPVNAFNMYNKLLSEIETRRFKSFDHAQEMIAASFGRPMPKPGKVCHIRALDEKGEMETISLDRPSDPRIAHVNYESLLLYLGTDKLIQVFASMLMERRLILCSRNLSALTQTIQALVALLYPFHWQHVYIPLLPPDMLEVCAAPTPFIIGVLKAHLPVVTALDLEDVIIVDLDDKRILRNMGDELSLLPKKVQKALKTAINMCKIDSDAQHSQWLMVSEAFLRMFVETVGHFIHHVFTQQDGTKTLMKDQFIAGAPSKGIRQFLEWFTETQMFEVFITMHLEKQHWGSMDLFLSRLFELQKKGENPAVKGIGQKVKNLGKALKTKLKD
ncbi:uncharacterized protein LOC143286535 isoform X2 [Babylonia areolata]|uniref:uncharacterized protein LOC143286535 isoform X2 n=1 Tax=Babylonia areolata TaxID=304850 RepID=UPI003FCF8E01